MNERSLQFLDYINELKNQGVRRTFFYEQIAESLRETKDKPRQTRRALAFAHMIDSVEQIVNPGEILVGSLMGNWPIDRTLPSYEERVDQAVERLEAFKLKKQSGRVTRNSRYAFIASDFFNSNIDHREYQKILGEMKVKYKDDILEEFEIGRELGDLFLYDYGDEVMALYNDLPYQVSHHNDLNYKKSLKYGLGGLLERAQQGYEDNRESDPGKAECY